MRSVMQGGADSSEKYAPQYFYSDERDTYKPFTMTKTGAPLYHLIMTINHDGYAVVINSVTDNGETLTIAAGASGSSSSPLYAVVIPVKTRIIPDLKLKEGFSCYLIDKNGNQISE